MGTAHDVFAKPTARVSPNSRQQNLSFITISFCITPHYKLLMFLYNINSYKNSQFSRWKKAGKATIDRS
jgi:hypothetical protein